MFNSCIPSDQELYWINVVRRDIISQFTLIYFDIQNALIFATSKHGNEKFNMYCHCVPFENLNVVLFSVTPLGILYYLLVYYLVKMRNSIFFHFAFLTIIAFSPCVRVSVKIQFLMIAIPTVHSEIGETSYFHCLPSHAETQF